MTISRNALVNEVRAFVDQVTTQESLAFKLNDDQVIQLSMKVKNVCSLSPMTTTTKAYPDGLDKSFFTFHKDSERDSEVTKMGTCWRFNKKIDRTICYVTVYFPEGFDNKEEKLLTTIFRIAKQRLLHFEKEASVRAWNENVGLTATVIIGLAGAAYLVKNYFFCSQCSQNTFENSMEQTL